MPVNNRSPPRPRSQRRCRCSISSSRPGGTTDRRRRSPTHSARPTRMGFAIDEFASLIRLGERVLARRRACAVAARFLRQAGLGFPELSDRHVAQEHPEFVTALTRYFTARFDPTSPPMTGTRPWPPPGRRWRHRSRQPPPSMRTGSCGRSLLRLGHVAHQLVSTRPGGQAQALCRVPTGLTQLLPRGPIVPFREIFVDSVRRRGHPRCAAGRSREAV